MALPPPPPPSNWGQPRVASGYRAEFWPRLGGWFIDGLILGAVNVVLQSANGQTAALVFGIGLRLAYDLYFIGSPSGQTVGMRAVGIRAIDAQTGGRVDYGRALVRVLMSYISGFACLLGYLWMLWDPEKQTWHDRVGGTYVVPTANYPVERWPG